MGRQAIPPDPPSQRAGGRDRIRPAGRRKAAPGTQPARRAADNEAVVETTSKSIKEIPMRSPSFCSSVLSAVGVGVGVAVVAVAGLAGCGETRLGRSLEREVQIVLAITAVPSDVTCVRLTAAGPGRTVTREVDVMPGAEVSEAFGGLPLGTVDFLGEAFSGACTAVTKATIPSWASDPVPAAVVLGRIATISLTLHRNGRAKVNVDFADEAACQPIASACLTSAECCTGTCTRGTCQPPSPDAAPDTR
jgi:hypothetical protein